MYISIHKGPINHYNNIQAQIKLVSVRDDTTEYFFYGLERSAVGFGNYF